jgi:hypothetical protein
MYILVCICKQKKYEFSGDEKPGLLSSVFAVKHGAIKFIDAYTGTWVW